MFPNMVTCLSTTFRVTVRKKVEKSLDDLPDRIQGKFWVTYHCHLSKDWVACWRWEKSTVEIEVYYAGSRENAPY